MLACVKQLACMIMMARRSACRANAYIRPSRSCKTGLFQFHVTLDASRKSFVSLHKCGIGSQTYACRRNRCLAGQKEVFVRSFSALGIMQSLCFVILQVFTMHCILLASIYVSASVLQFLEIHLLYAAVKVDHDGLGCPNLSLFTSTSRELYPHGPFQPLVVPYNSYNPHVNLGRLACRAQITAAAEEVLRCRLMHVISSYRISKFELSVLL